MAKNTNSAAIAEASLASFAKSVKTMQDRGNKAFRDAMAHCQLSGDACYLQQLYDLIKTKKLHACQSMLDCVMASSPYGFELDEDGKAIERFKKLKDADGNPVKEWNTLYVKADIWAGVKKEAAPTVIDAAYVKAEFAKLAKKLHNERADITEDGAKVIAIFDRLEADFTKSSQRVLAA